MFDVRLYILAKMEENTKCDHLQLIVSPSQICTHIDNYEHSGLLVAHGTLNPKVTLVPFLSDELKRNEDNLKHTRHWNQN